LPKGKTVIQVNVDESDVNRIQLADSTLIGDAKLVLQQLIGEAEQHKDPNRVDVLEEIRKTKQAKEVKYRPHSESNAKPVDPYRVYAEMAKELDPLNCFVTHESGNTRDQLVTIWESRIQHGFMGWGNVSTLGFGLAAAMGAKISFPERQVVSVTGDAGFGYQVGNYEALVRLKLGITTIHINNSGFGGYGPGYWGLGHSPYTYTVTPSGVMKTWKVAEAIGMSSERIEDPDEVGPAIKRALKKNQSGDPAFIEVICSMQPIFGGWRREWS
jgi:acetolactate synthase-1/2/3 large subunit